MSGLNAPALISSMTDYEPGTFTPTLVGAVSGVTYGGDRFGNYRELAGLVFVEGLISTTGLTIDDAGGVVRLGGLPFAGAVNQSIHISHSATWAGDRPSLGVFWNAGTELTLLYRTAINGDGQFLRGSDCATGNGNTLTFSGSYSK